MNFDENKIQTLTQKALHFLEKADDGILPQNKGKIRPRCVGNFGLGG